MTITFTYTYTSTYTNTNTNTRFLIRESALLFSWLRRFKKTLISAISGVGALVTQTIKRPIRGRGVAASRLPHFTGITQ